MTQVIGISGLARAGKNLFGEILKKQLIEKGYSVQMFALADALKRDCEDFLKDKCNLDVWTQDTSTKSQFREFLVWYGKLQRKRSNGTYWTNLLEHQIRLSKADISIVTDIRYAEYDHDEVQWVTETMGGSVIHILKYSYVNRQDNGVGPVERVKEYVEPPNDDERRNDPVVRSISDVPVEWEHKLEASVVPLEENPYLNQIVADAVKELDLI